MNLIEIINQAKAKGIMPVLKDEVFLRVFKDTVRAIKYSKYRSKEVMGYRTIFNIKNGEVELYNSQKNNMENYGYIRGNTPTSWNLVAKTEVTTNKINAREKIGEELETYEYVQEYNNVNGNVSHFKEPRTRVRAVYIEKIKYIKFDTIMFYKKDGE